MSIPSSGSSTPRSASTTSSFVGMSFTLEQPHVLALFAGCHCTASGREYGLCPCSLTTSCHAPEGGPLQKADFLAALAGEEVDPVDEAHPVAVRAHDERVRARGVGEVADAAQQLAVRHPRRDDDHVLRREIVDREDAVDVVDTVLAGRFDLG